MNVITQMNKRIKLLTSQFAATRTRCHYDVCNGVCVKRLGRNSYELMHALANRRGHSATEIRYVACYPCEGFVSEQIADDVSWLSFRLNEFDRCCAELRAGSRKDSPVLGDCWRSGFIFSTCGADLRSVSWAFVYKATPILQEASANFVIILKTVRTWPDAPTELKNLEEEIAVTSCSVWFVFAWACRR